MLGRIVEIAEPARHLSLHRGFMKVSHEGETLGLVPLDDLLGIVVTGHGATHSSNLLAKLAEHGISFCICGNNFTPVSMMLPVDGNVAQSRRLRLQAETKQPRRKRLWSMIVVEKIHNQAEVLRRLGKEGAANRLGQMARSVRSGDTANVEAQAARHYWPALFGTEFRRRQAEPGLNALLNYGYAIIRSCMARAVLGAGLHPTLGLNHQGPTNPMCLVDDFMEPFRPFCDLAVYGLSDRGIAEVSIDAKRALVNLTTIDIPGTRGVTTLFTAMSEFVLSYVRVVEENSKSLAFATLPDNLSFAALFDDPA